MTNIMYIYGSAFISVNFESSMAVDFIMAISYLFYKAL